MRIDLLLFDRKSYTYEGYVAQKVKSCLENQGLSVLSVYLGEGVLQDYLTFIQTAPPAWTLSFSDLLKTHKPLCEITRIPHFLWIERSFASVVHYLNNPFAQLGVPSLSLSHCFPDTNMRFLPHGMEPYASVARRTLEVVYFADLIDREKEHGWKRHWEEFVSPSILAVLQEVVQTCLHRGTDRIYETLITCLDKRKIASRDVSLNHLVACSEEYLKAFHTSSVIYAFQSTPLHVFGEHIGCNLLKKIPSCVHLHSSLPFTQHFEVLSQSQIVLLDSMDIWYKQALSCGCLPLLTISESLQESVEYFLHHPHEREKMIENLRIVNSSNSWESQTNQLVEWMPC